MHLVFLNILQYLLQYTMFINSYLFQHIFLICFSSHLHPPPILPNLPYSIIPPPLPLFPLSSLLHRPPSTLFTTLTSANHLHLVYSRSYKAPKRFLAGSLAGVTSVILTYPLDLARARMAVTSKKALVSQAMGANFVSTP